MTAGTHDIVAFACLVGSVAGALAPDLDQTSNRLWDMLPVGEYIGKVLNPNYVDSQLVIASVMVGFVSHIFIDMFTKEGVPKANH